MGELILCNEPIAPAPYYMDEMNLNIYSLEELSYYIYHNVYLLNADFMSVDIVNWIGRELSLTALSEELMDLLKENVPLHIFVGKILNACGYLTSSEIKDVLEIISVFENKSEAECKKIRADRLMERNRIVDAIYEYEDLLTGADNIATTLLGDIWHNLGTAYVRLFFFPEAKNCFLEAYKRNRRRQSIKSALFCCLCMKDDEAFKEIVKRYEIREEDVDLLRVEMEHVQEDEEILRFSDSLDRLRTHYSSQGAYISQLDHILSGWKDEYNRLCKM